MRTLSICIAAAAIAMTSCSLQTFENSDCSNNRECQQEFGWGSVCESDGFCSEPQQFNRCSITEPRELFSDPAEYRDRIIIGSLSNFVTSGIETNAVILALDEASQSGLGGREFGLVQCDYSTPSVFDTFDEFEATRAIVDYLVTTLGVQVIIGAHDSALTIAAFNRIQELGANTVLITPKGTAPQVFSIDETTPTDQSPGQLWRTVPQNDVVAAAMAIFLNEERVDEQVGDPPADVVVYESIAIVYQDNTDGLALMQEIRNNLDDEYDVEVFPFTGEGRTAAVDSAAATDPDWAIFIHSLSSELTFMLDDAGANGGYSDIRILLPDVGRDDFLPREAQGGNPDFPELVGLADLMDQIEVNGEMVYHIVGVSPSPDRDGGIWDSFRNRYQGRFPNVDPDQSAFTAHAYDATWLAIYGIAYSFGQNFGEIDANLIAQGLRRLSNPDATETFVGRDSWTSARTALQTPNPQLNIRGASGALDYDLDTEELVNREEGNPSFTLELWGLVAGMDECGEDADGRCFVTIEEDIDIE